MSMYTEQQAKAILDKVIALCKADECTATLGGGIKEAAVKNQFEVGSNDKRVRLNRFGGAPIGAIAGSGQSLENISYSYLESKSVEGKKIVFTGTQQLSAKGEERTLVRFSIDDNGQVLDVNTNPKPIVMRSGI